MAINRSRCWCGLITELYVSELRARFIVSLPQTLKEHVIYEQLETLTERQLLETYVAALQELRKLRKVLRAHPKAVIITKSICGYAWEPELGVCQPSSVVRGLSSAKGTTCAIWGTRRVCFTLLMMCWGSTGPSADGTRPSASATLSRGRPL